MYKESLFRLSGIDQGVWSASHYSRYTYTHTHKKKIWYGERKEGGGQVECRRLHGKRGCRREKEKQTDSLHNKTSLLPKSVITDLFPFLILALSFSFCFSLASCSSGNLTLYFQYASHLHAKERCSVRSFVGRHFSRLGPRGCGCAPAARRCRRLLLV